MPRIEAFGTVTNAISKMAGGNPGAMMVCLKIMDEASDIDPDNVLGGHGILMFLDTYRIYEERIWMFYKDVCNEDLPTMIAVIHACQLEIIGRRTLNLAIDNRGSGIDVGDIIKEIKNRLPAFLIDVPDTEQLLPQ